MGDIPRPAAIRRDGISGLRLKGLGTRLILAQLLVAALLLSIAWLSRARSREAETRVLRVYDHLWGQLIGVYERP